MCVLIFVLSLAKSENLERIFVWKKEFAFVITFKWSTLCRPSGSRVPESNQETPLDQLRLAKFFGVQIELHFLCVCFTGDIEESYLGAKIDQPFRQFFQHSKLKCNKNFSSLWNPHRCLRYYRAIRLGSRLARHSVPWIGQNHSGQQPGDVHFVKEAFSSFSETRWFFRNSSAFKANQKLWNWALLLNGARSWSREFGCFCKFKWKRQRLAQPVASSLGMSRDQHKAKLKQFKP